MRRRGRGRVRRPTGSRPRSSRSTPIPLPFEEIRTDAQQERRITHGQTVLVRDARIDEGDWVKLVNGRREFVAVGTVVESIGEDGVGVVQPKIVFK